MRIRIYTQHKKLPWGGLFHFLVVLGTVVVIALPLRYSGVRMAYADDSGGGRGGSGGSNAVAVVTEV